MHKLSEFVRYKRAVWKETNKNVNQIPNYNASKRGRCSLTKDTYQVDHKFSIFEGFMESICPTIIGHVSNLEFLPWRENLKKWTKSSISKEELLAMVAK